MQPKHIGIIVAVLAVIAALWFTVGGGKKAKDGDSAAAKTATDGENAGEGKGATVVKAEEGLSDKAEAKAEQLALPGALPTLKNVQGAADTPAQPHGKMELEGDVQEADAEAAIKAVFPALRDCYAELKKIAPQAGGRMLMKFSVKPGAEPGQAALGELFLKETQFTEPKFLTCIRTAVDAAKFPVGKNLTGSVTVPLFLTPGDVGEPTAAK
jgi:hypothetical protein